MPRNVVITGGGTGLGRATAERFAAAGDTVVITGRRAEVLNRAAAELTGDATAIACDHTDPAQLAALAQALPDRIDVLVNNAGGNTDIGGTPPDPADLAGIAAAWRRNLDANLISAVLTTALLRDRIATGGTLIHIGSIAADKGTAGSYSAAKAGLASWNIGLAAELGPHDITSNVLSPGFVAETEFFGESPSPEGRRARVAATMVGRAGVPAEIAATAFFLASVEARYLTAQVIQVDGGSTPRR